MRAGNEQEMKKSDSRWPCSFCGMCVWKDGKCVMCEDRQVCRSARECEKMKVVKRKKMFE